LGNTYDEAFLIAGKNGVTDDVQTARKRSFRLSRLNLYTSYFLDFLMMMMMMFDLPMMYDDDHSQGVMMR
jgi:hypothetical protein